MPKKEKGLKAALLGTIDLRPISPELPGYCTVGLANENQLKGLCRPLSSDFECFKNNRYFVDFQMVVKVHKNEIRQATVHRKAFIFY